MRLSRRVRELRYAKGWGPDDLADRAKISRTALYQIENGKTERPQAGTLRRIAQALGTTPENLLMDAAEPSGAGKRSAALADWPAPRVPPPTLHDLELERRFRILLASPLRDGITRLIEESYRLLPEAYRLEVEATR
jgi:transcriptional regulator with XRE-family HTH domain